MEQEMIEDHDDTIEDQDDEAVLSMADILKEDPQLLEDADAVLGGSDENDCTYLMGYVDRQALYSCRTCAAASGQPAGVCLACSLECHEGHDLIELYTKRDFRCDCGNSKFCGFTCKLCPNKMPVNNNHYNHNYSGVYCKCSRPYPDPDDSTDDMMIQCVICEDWFHSRHLSSDRVCLADDEFDEMVCDGCMQRCHFLWPYAKLCKAVYDKDVAFGESVNVDVVGDSNASSPSLISSEPSNVSGSALLPVASSSSVTMVAEDELKVEMFSLARFQAATGDASLSSCRLMGVDMDAGSRCGKGAVFWPADWRNQICRCRKCMDMYSELEVLFLLQQNDTISAYEERGKRRTKTSQTSLPAEHGMMDALSKLPHVQKVEVIEDYVDFKSELKTFLNTFAENKKVVRKEDVSDFFAELRARKRQKTSSMQYFCK